MTTVELEARLGEAAEQKWQCKSSCEQYSGMVKIEPEDIFARYMEYAGEVIKKGGGGMETRRTPPPPKPFKRYFVQISLGYRENYPFAYTSSSGLPDIPEITREQFKQDSIGCTIYKKLSSECDLHTLCDGAKIPEEHWFYVAKESQ